MDSLFSHASVYAVVIANEEGFPLAYRARDKSFTSEDAERTAALMSSLVGRTKDAINRLERGSVSFFTIDLSSGEILVALEKDYFVIAIRERDKS